jgi:cytochrome c oxidase assembly protein subunit 15
VKRLCLVGVAALGAQALLGGLTVLLKLPPQISVSHAGLAMAFFCLSVTVALVTSAGWRNAPERGDEKPGTPSIRGLTLITTCAIYFQILLGAVMRHTGAGLVIPDFPLVFGKLYPTFFAPPIVVNYAHRLGALVVTALVVLLVVRVARHYGKNAAFRRPALFLSGTLAAQVFLGALTIWTRKSVVPTTAHVALGAVVLATSLVITLRAWRFAPWRLSPDAVEAHGEVKHPSGIFAADDLHLNSGES